jgi:hypothetical protein
MESGARNAARNATPEGVPPAGSTAAAGFDMDRIAGGPSVVCASCQAPNPAGADRCAKCRAFLPGNQVAVTTGQFRRQQPNELRAEVEAIVAGIIADKGGAGELSTIQKALVEEIGNVALLLRLFVADIAARGLFTERGAARRVFGDYLSALDRFDRLTSRIGLKREARPLRSNLEEFVRVQR